MMISDKELMDTHARVLFRCNESGDLTAINEKEPQQAPLFFLGQTKEGDILLFHSTLTLPIRRKISEAVHSRTDSQTIDPFIEIITSYQHIQHIWTGPSFLFPSSYDNKSTAIEITRNNTELLAEYFPDLMSSLEEKSPVYAIINGGTAVSVCFSARKSNEAAEAGVETTSAWRGQGFGAETAKAWASHTQNRGLMAMYSTSHDNKASIAVAEKLHLHRIGMDFHIT